MQILNLPIRKFYLRILSTKVLKNVMCPPLHNSSNLTENFLNELPSKHLLVLKTSSTRLQRDNFTSSKTSWRRLTKTSWRRLRRRKIVTLKTSWRRLQDMSWRCLQDMSGRHLEDFMETNKILTEDICIPIWG